MSFPVDDATLLAIEHALGGAYTIENGEHVLVGADYSLSQLLDFLADCLGEDPDRTLIKEGDPQLPGLAGAPIYEDTRVHYSERDVIRALILEIRRLRAATR